MKTMLAGFGMVFLIVLCIFILGDAMARIVMEIESWIDEPEEK